MKIYPEFDLEDDLEIPYKPDLKDWIEDNLPGLKKIEISLMIRRDNYDPKGSIEFYNKDEKNTPVQKPKHEGKDIKPDEICELIMKIIQVSLEEYDSGGKYRIQCHRIIGNTTAPRKVSKHIEVPRLGGEEEPRFVTNLAEQENADVIPTLMSYIQRLQDQDVVKSKLITDIVQPLQAQNLALQQRIIELSNVHLGVAQLEAQRWMWEKDKELETQLGSEKIKADKEKKIKMWDTLKESRALESLAAMGMEVAKHKFGVEIPMQQKIQQQKQQKQQDEKERRDKIEEEFRMNPLKARCNLVWGSLDDDQKEKIANELKDDFIYFQELLTSSSEKEATVKLQSLMEKFKDDPMKLMNAGNMLHEEQQKVVMWIINFGINMNG